MELKRLQYFVMVVQQSSFSEAAKKLHLSQPSLSKAIKNLECEVGFQLLERTTKRVQLTESGNVVYERALKILHEIDILQQEIKEVKWTGSGSVQIGVIESVKNWLPSILHAYRQEFPSMHVKLIEVLDRGDVERALRQYAVHVCLTNQYIKAPDIVTIPLYQEQLAVVMHPEHRLASKDTITLADLEDEAFIVTSVGLQTSQDIFAAFAEEGVRMNICYEVERFETIVELIRENIGISMIPQKYFAHGPDPTIVSKIIHSKTLTRTVYLTYLKKRYMPPAIEMLVSNMQMQRDSSVKWKEGELDE
ncbi:LysR family transcriptional regulator [Sporosarcina sp. P21c]|uniref:LysR family transcriptional regulator n=1 Tax=Sporosarcina TaxID=1569 RepID=UPI000A16A58A|nr:MULTISPECIES: LysR family transcriptional regulator [Sporosarcina]ARJ39218.1 LysR family transcriptional regulator [Sporosarcina ureae]PIC66069.1 LysR family transcriptional regulator [Sporosarcina sp. P16a]PIC82513.1 LysR family transcriptional regulator [Sporosarcina sp. P1]PIC88384.1 LysR family transcriptional regulator [Sporosarcina sp. P21c]PIC91671.1 LysR family transcriptional regulator [Sporosarcina sp. P25]